MDTKQKLEQALKDAIRSSNDVGKRTMRMVLTNIKLAEVEKGGPLDEVALAAVLQKEIKSRKESIAEAKIAHREDLVQASQAEIDVLETFLPQPLTDDELRAQIQAVVAEVNASSPADMGKVMKVLLPRLQGRAANDRVSQMVRQMLQG